VRHPTEQLVFFMTGILAIVTFVGCDEPKSSESPARSAPDLAAVSELAPEPLSNHFVGSSTCVGCHPGEGLAWTGSDHDRAMEEPTPASIVGRFDGSVVRRQGESWRFLRDGDDYIVEHVIDHVAEDAAGRAGDEPDTSGDATERMRVAYTFGFEPLQQYLVERPGGRMQALPIAWDARDAEEGGERWIDLQAGESVPPDDPLHWEGLAYNWNSQCAACHSTNLSKGYDADRNHFASAWAEVDVGCEACHGPGSGHVAVHDPGIDAPPGTSGLAVAFDAWDAEAWARSPDARIASRVVARENDAQIDVCAPCHSRRTQLVDTPVVGAAFLDGHRPALLEPDLYFEDGQIQDEVYVWGSFLQSRMHAAGVRCNDCHDSHSLRLRREGNALCTGCHAPTAYDVTEHHGHAIDSAGSNCVDCHMPTRVYMSVDARRDHSFPVPRPARSASLGAPDTCTGCHTEREPAWAVAQIASWRDPDVAPSPHWSDRLIDGDGARADVDRWTDIALDESLPPIVRASAWSRYAREAADSDSAARMGTLRERLRAGSELERLAIIDAARTLAPESRLSLLRPLIEDERLAIRVSAAEVLLDLPADLWKPADRAAFARALGEHRARLVANAERPDAQVGLGTLAIAYREPDAARDAYLRAIELAPYFVPAHVNLADLERMLGRDAESVSWLARAVELAPEDAYVRHALGLALYRAERHAEALEELERAAMANPDEPRMLLAWALALDGQGRRGEATAALGAAVDRGVRSGDLQHALVTLLRDQGEIESALARAEAWRVESPGDPRPQALIRELMGPR